MKYIPAFVLLGLALMCWAMSVSKPGQAMSSSFMVVPAGGLGILAVLAALAAWAL